MHEISADTLQDFGCPVHAGHAQAKAAVLLTEWLHPLAALPIDNETLAMAIASLLTAEGIGHRALLGNVNLVGVGTFPRHQWIELDAGLCIDFRGRQWLDDPRVPVGAFLPDDGQRYNAHHYLNGHYSPTVFFALVGVAMTAFPAPEGLVDLLRGTP